MSLAVSPSISRQPPGAHTILRRINGYEGMVSAEPTGIIAMLFTSANLSFEIYSRFLRMTASMSAAAISARIVSIIPARQKPHNGNGIECQFVHRCVPTPIDCPVIFTIIPANLVGDPR